MESIIEFYIYRFLTTSNYYENNKHKEQGQSEIYLQKKGTIKNLGDI